ncbi:S-adenosyl-L-methionine-dependent methyltransferase [Multifurca ochricompacta]|uniref:Protein arginine methyltransferase NDUFAF7 n=1 Tax=Multifurca ochricompacta TaxID=376703 RepID=A0AAD4LU50_9AGAM|nr:S-adenosyl-L-methionine-dependent methyltransferase [Multifurca ochricompacta]
MFFRRCLLHTRLVRRVLQSRQYAQSSHVVPSVTPVEKILLDTIKVNGPVSFATYMQLCLSHPTEGYYMNPANAVIGARISQVFGELLGIWLLSHYLTTGAKHDIQLVELGPGRGTLMDDILRTLSQLPHSRTSVKHVHLVESSPALRSVQQKKLQSWDGKNNLKIHWHDSIDDIPTADGVYTMLVAHEFFDALPFHLIEKTHQGWKEVLITSTPDPAAKRILRPSDVLTSSLDLDRSSSSTATSKTRFRSVLAPDPSPVSTLLGASSPRFGSLPIGARIEVSATSFQAARKLGMLISQGAGGSALVVDYGANHAVGNSFRAFKKHALVDPFEFPGQADLTANVDFAYLAEALAGTAKVHGPLSQRAFLLHMGIGTRVGALQRAASTSSKENGDALAAAAARLVDAAGMGGEYKVMGVTSGGGVEKEKEKEEGAWPFIAGEIER